MPEQRCKQVVYALCGEQPAKSANAAFNGVFGNRASPYIIYYHLPEHILAHKRNAQCYKEYRQIHHAFLEENPRNQQRENKRNHNRDKSGVCAVAYRAQKRGQNRKSEAGMPAFSVPRHKQAPYQQPRQQACNSLVPDEL